MQNKLNEWCSKWKMSIAETKTNVVHFRTKNLRHNMYLRLVINLLMVWTDKNIYELF